MTLAETLEAALEAGDPAAVRDLLAGRSEAERAELMPLARRHVAEVARRGLDGLSALRPMLFVAYGVLPATEIRKLGWRANQLVNLERLEEVLRRRAPERLAPIIDHLLDDLGGRAWPVVRALVRDGVVPRPERPSYTVAMLAATRYADLSEVLEADPALLDVEVWRLFEVEGGGEDSLAAHEKYTGDRWGDLFRELAARDPATRHRLLDASLGALARDFGTFRAGWFSRFHESLAPSDDERAERIEAYLRLLRSRSGPTVSFAIAALARIGRTRGLPLEPLLERIGPVLTDGTAATAKAALDLVARAGSEADRAHDAALATAAGLAHPSPDVQGRAITVVGKLITQPNDAVARAVGRQAANVAASQRPALEALLTRLDARAHGDIGAVTGSLPAVATAAGATRVAEAPASALDPSRALEPLRSVDALVDVAVSLVETGEPADDIERVLHAVGLLTAERSDRFQRLTGPLAKRARTILGRRDSTPFNGFDARADIAAVLLAWATGEVVAPSAGHARADPGAGAFLSARAREVAAAAGRGEPFASVAAPTHRGGWIDPVVLVERLRAGSPASRLDLVAALLRLGSEHRDEALERAADLSGEPGSTVRYALGADERIGPTAAWWVAAARVRSPGQDDDRVEQRHPGLGPNAGRAARATLVVREPAAGSSSSFGAIRLRAQPEPAGDVDVGLPTVLMLRDASAFAWVGRSEPAMLRWVATIQPGDREAWAAIGSAVLARNVDWWSAQWANRAYLEPFIDPVTAIGPHARRLIGVAMGARETAERGPATDIVRHALTDGRMSADDLAEGLAAAAAIGCDRPNRWAQSLGDAASGTDAGVVCRAIMGALPAIADRPPTKLVPLLRLLNELLAETREPVIPAARPSLTRLGSSGGQAGRLARAILSRG